MPSKWQTSNVPFLRYCTARVEAVSLNAKPATAGPNPNTRVSRLTTLLLRIQWREEVPLHRTSMPCSSVEGTQYNVRLVGSGRRGM